VSSNDSGDADRTSRTAAEAKVMLVKFDEESERGAVEEDAISPVIADVVTDSKSKPSRRNKPFALTTNIGVDANENTDLNANWLISRVPALTVANE
jgi:hypothetical protein